MADDKAYRARYKLLHEKMQKQAEKWLSGVEAEEAALAEVLRRIPPKLEAEFATVKRDLFVMKDDAHKLKKTLRTLGKRTKVTASAILIKNADVKLLKKLMRKHSLTFKQMAKNVTSLDSLRKQLQKLVAGKAEDN